MRRRPISPEQGPTSQQLAAFTDGGLAPEQQKQVRAWLVGHLQAPAQAGAEAEANHRLLRLLRASRPKEPSPDAWEQLLTRIESALMARGRPREMPTMCGLSQPRWRQKEWLRSEGSSDE
jgi:hypothetical protein